MISYIQKTYILKIVQVMLMILQDEHGLEEQLEKTVHVTCR